MADLASLGTFFESVGTTIGNDYSQISLANAGTPVLAGSGVPGSPLAPQFVAATATNKINWNSILLLAIVAVAAIFGFKALRR